MGAIVSQSFAVLVTVLLLLGGGGLTAGILNYALGSIFFGPLWQPGHLGLRKIRIRLLGLFALFLLLQVAIAVSQTLWPVIDNSRCTLIRFPQHVQAALMFAPTSGSAPWDAADPAVVDRITLAALLCGVALAAWLTGNMLVQTNRIERPLDCLLVLLFVAPLGTSCAVIVPSVACDFFFKIAIFRQPLPQVDVLLWHGVVLIGGGSLGAIYSRAAARWLARRLPAGDRLADRSPPLDSQPKPGQPET